MSFQTLDETTEKALEKNVRDLTRNIEKIKKEKGIARDIVLLAATKTVPAEVINYATHKCGIKVIGENRVQELLEKYDKLDLDGVELQFIGKLQTNKVKYIIDKVDLIHSVDNEKLASEIDRQAKKHGIIMDILVEINIGREENKSGILPENVPSFLEFLSGLENVRVKGFMTIAPNLGEKEAYRKYFRDTYSIFIDNSKKKYHNIDVKILSMGMSGSYETAVEEGSTLVRIGSGIFGERDYSKNN